MCGIVAYVGDKDVRPVLIEGLKRLEYRGYDSAGVCIGGKDGFFIRKAAGRISVLESILDEEKAIPKGHVGMAHTRWATHGAPSKDNAHPHASHDCIAIVHNGIIENHEVLRAGLRAQGEVFTSETDSEVIAHLVYRQYQVTSDLLRAVQDTVALLQGSFAILVMATDAPGRLVCARRGSPLLIGVGIEEHFVASDVSALLPVTQRVVYLEEGDVADIGLLSYRVFDAAGNLVMRLVNVSEQSAEMSDLGAYRHFMQKEIHEQPRALADTLHDVLMSDHLPAQAFGHDAEAVFARVDAVRFLACGTSYHAALIGAQWIEALAGLPCQAEVASEYRYRDSVANPRALVVTLSQSGETADTLAALKHAQHLGHNETLSICNVPESSLVRASALRFLTRAGPEIGVASTKAFTAQLAALFLLALLLARSRGRLSPEQEHAHIHALRALPSAVGRVLALEHEVAAWAQRLADKRHALFLGRGIHFPIALEGALKLKEISYIHAEAYPAGELKHGPLALVDHDMPVVAIAPDDALLDKLRSNLQEVAARGGELYVLTDTQTSILSGSHVHHIRMDEHAGWLSPILHVIPLQMLAYHAALQKGTDVDKPRNLAKSVTVE